MTNVNGNYKNIKKKYKSGNLKTEYQRILESGKTKVKETKIAAKKFGKKIAGKATVEQKFLGKTLPKYIGKAAKFAFKNPITTTALFFVPDTVKFMGKQKGIDFSPTRQYDKKGRKFL